MGKIPNYAHYYMSDGEITSLHREEIQDAFQAKGFDGLSSYEKDWFVKYFPDQIPKKEKEM